MPLQELDPRRNKRNKCPVERAVYWKVLGGNILSPLPGVA